jgi:glyoxylase-like metal-dependent hydrolase (beta-lactamase superfamily II)
METEMSYGSDYHYLPVTSLESGKGYEVIPDIFCHTIQIVNVSFIGLADKDEWVLVDAGMPKSADHIISASEERFGSNSRPAGIVLTHGHFDHVGAIVELIEHWNVPVYAHELEIPYLTGKQSYSPPDPTVEGGLVAKMSLMFPIEPINLGKHVEQLSPDGTIPIMPEWRWIHTPGHTPGHVSLFRDSDHSLIAGDAFVTVKQESIYNVFTQEQEISGPPRYLTPDWQLAWESVRKLEALKPAIAVTGHGLPMKGELLTTSLQKLVKEFDRIAIPDYGRYIKQ